MPVVPEDYVNLVFKMSPVIGGLVATCQVGGHIAAGPFDQSAIEAVQDAWESNIMPVLSADWQLVGVHATIGTATDPTFLEYSEVDSGGNAGDATPPNICYLIEKFAAVGGRKNRGRMFVPGVVEGTVNEVGAVTAAQINLLNTAFSDFGDAMVTTANTELDALVIFHSDLSTPTTIVQFSCDAIVGKQDRRLKR